jgi:hypothetical protein
MNLYVYLTMAACMSAETCCGKYDEYVICKVLCYSDPAVCINWTDTSRWPLMFIVSYTHPDVPNILWQAAN